MASKEFEELKRLTHDAVFLERCCQVRKNLLDWGERNQKLTTLAARRSVVEAEDEHRYDDRAALRKINKWSSEK